MKFILLVDDDPQILDGLADILEDAGYAVSKASTGAQALALASERTPAAVLIDFNLPDGTGVVWASRLREKAPRARIFLLTGMATGDLPETPATVDEVLTKPVPLQDLLSRLAALPA